MKLLIVFAALLAVGILSLLEWRRADRRHLAARIGATFLAVGALALWGWRPAWHRPGPSASPGGNAAALWTAGALAGDDTGAPAFHDRFALPGAANAPAGVVVLPDAGTLRRRFPAVGALHIYGDGLEAFDAEALRGLNIVFHPPADRATREAAAFSFVRCPRTLSLGEMLTVQGRVSGLPPADTATVTLEAPDGTTTTATAAPGFTVTGAPPPAAGRFVWRLRLGKDGGTEEKLGVAVAAPRLPRVLALAGAPSFDTAALRRWFETAGGTFTARTLVGRDRYRFESAHDPPPQFAALDAALLAGFDLVLADGRALAALPPPERDALRVAIADTGLGLLTLADDADAAGIAPALFPWKLTVPANADGERLTRVQWPGQTVSSEIPLPLAPLDLAPLDGQTALMRDGQGRTLTASVARGRGLIALTLVRETGRWTRGNDSPMFAAYWSELFSVLARRATAADAGRWTLAGGDAGPVFVDQPLELVWSGPTPPAPASGTVTAEAHADARPVTLALAPDSERWRGTFWPREPGWHRVSGPSGTPLDFFVHPARSWPVLDAARRRAATARLAEESAATPPRASTAATAGETVPIPVAGWFALFLAAAGYLWIERRVSS